MPLLKQDNITHFRDLIPYEQLPKTFKDAIRIERALGIRYLWIDSLCIVQDSSANWQREAAMMAEVYANSVCNIAATGAVDWRDGIFLQSRLFEDIVLYTHRYCV